MKLKKYLFLIILFIAPIVQAQVPVLQAQAPVVQAQAPVVHTQASVVQAQDTSDKNNQDKIVAKVGKDYEVTLSDLKQYISDWRYLNKFRDKTEAYEHALNDLTVNQLKIFDFFNRKLNEKQELMGQIRLNINFQLLNGYFDKEFVKKYTNANMAAEAYKVMDREVITDEIILPAAANAAKEELDSLRTIAVKIEDGFSKKYSITRLIKLYSLKNIKVNNEKRVTWSESIVDPVAHVIFKLQKGFTRVINSLDGFHIVRVLDIKKIKLEPFEKIKDEIQLKLQNGFYQVYNDEYDNYRAGTIDNKSIKWNQSGLDQIVEWSSGNATFYGGAFKDTIQNAISRGNNFEILSYNNGKVDLKEYLRLLKEVIILNPNITLNSVSVKDFILNAVYDDKVIKDAQKLGLEKELVNPYTKNPVIKDRLIYLYNQAVIEGSIPETTPEALKKFYETNKDSIFYQLNKINIYARIYSDSTEAAADINEINKGTPFEKVSNRWWNKAYIRERDGTLNSYHSPEPPYLAKAAFKLGLNEVSGPIEFYDSTKGKQFAVIKCIYIQPEKQLSYEEVKGKRAEDEFKNYYRQKISGEVEVMLKKKYGIKIFENTLSEAISSNRDE